MSAGLGYQAIPMEPQGNDLFSASLPPQPAGVWVQYYLSAEDDVGHTATDPPGAPGQAFGYVAGYTPPPVYLNELMADNETTLEDPDEPGEYPDWFELYNPGPEPAAIGGLYLTDDLGDPSQFQIPEGLTISPGAFLLFYADDDVEQGPQHTSFKLSADGEALGLFGAGGKVRLDSVEFGAQAVDLSLGRLPNGIGLWYTQSRPTPGKANGYRFHLPLIARSPAP